MSRRRQAAVVAETQDAFKTIHTRGVPTAGPQDKWHAARLHNLARDALNLRRFSGTIDATENKEPAVHLGPSRRLPDAGQLPVLRERFSNRARP